MEGNIFDLEFPHPIVWTPELFEKIPNNSFFAKGFFVDDESGVNIAGTGNIVKWVAVKGDVEDWAIYFQNPFMGSFVQDFREIAEHGEKMYYIGDILSLMSITAEMMDLYRF